jgi:hypothetical protein
MKKHFKKLGNDWQVRQAILLLVHAGEPSKQVRMNKRSQIGRVLDRW